MRLVMSLRSPVDEATSVVLGETVRRLARRDRLLVEVHPALPARLGGERGVGGLPPARRTLARSSSSGPGRCESPTIPLGLENQAFDKHRRHSGKINMVRRDNDCNPSRGARVLGAGWGIENHTAG